MAYFDLFPQVLYGNTVCTDITRRVGLTEQTRNALTLYYNYVVKNGMRADVVASAYYKDATLDWLLWLTNDVIDPYYQWNMNDFDFQKYLIGKYGSVENSIRKIVKYRNNWYDDEHTLTPNFYNNTLAENWRKYYMPVFDSNSNSAKILYYKRREEDWVVETNRIYKLNVEYGGDLNVGDIINVYDPTGTKRHGGGEITNVGDDVAADTESGSIFIKNIDEVSPGMSTGDLLLTTHSNTTISQVSVVYEAITTDEEVFWSPVTAFDVENEKNAYARQIRILDISHVLPAIDNVRKLLNT